MKKRKNLVAALLAGVLLSFTGLEAAGASLPDSFEDVEQGRFYYDAVYWALENGVTTGTSATTFSPEEACTRAQTVAFLWRMAGEPEPENLDTGFEDVDSGRFYAKAVAWAVENGVTTGTTPTTFEPNGICSRGEFVTFLYRAAGKPEANIYAMFTDVEEGRYYEKPVSWAVENGVTTGTTPVTFSPGDVCTRGHVVTFLYRWATGTKVKIVNVQDFGAVPGDDIDDTDAIQNAANEEGAEMVYVPAGVYVVNAEPGIKLQSNTNLVMDPEAVLEVKGNSQDHYNVIRARNAANISIYGGQIIGERDKHTGSEGEWGMGIGLYDCKNVTVANVKISKNWGDGIYVGSTDDFGDDLYGCDNIKIMNCEIFENRRSNISIVNADNVTIDGCRIADAGGHAPQCGINIEANTIDGTVPDEAICRNIKISNTVVDVLGKGDVNGQYFGFRTQRYHDRSTHTADNVIIENCTFNGDCGNYSGTNMTISNTVIRGCFYDMQNTTLNNVSYEEIWRG